MKNFIALSFATFALIACASTGSLPDSAAEVDFSVDAVGKTGWSQYEDTLVVNGIDRQTAFLAAKDGLASASFTVKSGSLADGFVKGARGMTAYDWNVVAGVYFSPTQNGFAFKVVAEGSKDIGFWGDATGSSWPQDIMRGIQNYIAREASVTDADRGVFDASGDNK